MQLTMLALSFISGNYVFQYFQDSPDYIEATNRSYFMGIAMLFIVLLPKLLKR